ncbi:MAG TPA: NADH-quinone oxidoreductase subunit J, partial [Gemmataceae bacterium]|nr:NADH-quinone oxidoreductase subunit J [Gemmataceae bacterium]
TVAGFVLLGALLCVLYRTYDTTTLDDLLARVDRAVGADSPAEVEKALGGYKEFNDALQKLLRRGPNQPPSVTRPAVKGQFNDAVTELEPELRKNPPDMKVVKGMLRDIRSLGTAYRASHGSLVAETKLPLSPFSGAPASTDVPLTPAGKVKERMPANNVSALGRSLFSDYLLAVELGGVLLLVATIGAIAIAGRAKEGLR